MHPAVRDDPFQAFGAPPERVNVAARFVERVREAPERTAVISLGSHGTESTDYAGLERRAARIARGLGARGVERGMRVSVFVHPGVDLIAVVYALFALGAVPVLADPGMGRKRLLAAVERVAPAALIGAPRALVARTLFRRAFRSVRLAVSVGGRAPWPFRGDVGLDEVAREGGEGALEPADTRADEDAAILFTSGSTGPPKGVVVTHGMLDAETRALGELYEFRAGEVDLCCFPLFALFDTAFGMTSVFPDMDPTRPGSCDPAKIWSAIERHTPSVAFGSPAVWRRVAPWASAHKHKLASLRRVLVAGAPVSVSLIEALHKILPPEGDVFTPYGATEALPVSSIAGRSVVPSLVERTTGGMGTCVGHPAPGIELRLIAIRDDAIHVWDDSLVVPPGKPGEVCVRGPVVTQVYAEEPEHTAKAKIPASDGGPAWHRMGDIARRDDEGQLWIGGRKSHRIETPAGLVLPVPYENVFDLHPRVRKTALVGIGERGRESLVLVVEPEEGQLPHGEADLDCFMAELRALAWSRSFGTEVERFLFHPHLPVDPRHNAKIHREELRVWAQRKLS